MKALWWLGAAVIVAVSTHAAQAADWPQWRGPERNGISSETGLLQQWPEGGPRLVWKQEGIGDGYSTPSVVGGRLYLLTNEGTQDEFVQARSVKDGSLIWSQRIGKVGNPDQRPPYPGTRSTPTVEGDVLYALGSDGDLVCLETANGKPRWSLNVREEFGGQPGEWAYCESPLIDGEKLICTPGGNEATLVALNKKTGETIWKAAVPGGDEAAYSSSIAVELDGTKQYVQFLAKGLVGVDAKTGKFLWRYDRTAEGSAANIPTPLEHEGHVYSASGRGGAALVRLKVNDGKVEAEPVYFSTRLPKAIGGIVRIGEHLYGTSDVLTCAEFETGEIKWQDRSIGTASVCYADGHLYLHGEDGEVALVEATPQGYREKGRFTPPEQPDRSGRLKSWTYPVIANGRLYLRDMGMLWCYDVQESQTGG